MTLPLVAAALARPVPNGEVGRAELVVRPVEEEIPLGAPLLLELAVRARGQRVELRFGETPEAGIGGLRVRAIDAEGRSATEPRRYNAATGMWTIEVATTTRPALYAVTRLEVRPPTPDEARRLVDHFVDGSERGPPHRLGHPELVPLLAEHLWASQVWPRRSAVDAIGTCPCLEATDVLVDALVHGRDDPNLRYHLIAQLGARYRPHADPSRSPFVDTWLPEHDDAVHAWAVSALSEPTDDWRSADVASMYLAWRARPEDTALLEEAAIRWAGSPPAAHLANAPLDRVDPSGEAYLERMFEMAEELGWGSIDVGVADWRAAWAAVRADDRSSDAIAAVVRAVGDPLLTDVPFRPWLASQEGPDVTDALLRGLATAEGPRALALVELLAPRVDADALAAAILARLDPEDPDPVLLWELRRSVDASACASFGWRVDGGVHPEALIDAWRTELAAHPGRPHPTSLLPSTFHCEP